MATSVLPSPVFISAIMPAVQHHAADELHVEVAHAERALGGLAHDRERLGQQVVERLAVGEALRGTRRSWRASSLVGERLHLGLEGVDLRDERLVLAELPALADGEELRQDVGHEWVLV